MIAASPHFLKAVDAYCAHERARVADFREGKVSRPGFTIEALCDTLDAQQVYAGATGRELAGLYAGLKWLAEIDPTLHDLCVERMRDVDAELRRYNDD